MLAFENLPELFETRGDVALWKPDLSQPLDVGEFLAALFQDDDCSPQTVGALGDAGLHAMAVSSNNDCLPVVHQLIDQGQAATDDVTGAGVLEWLLG